MDSLYVNKALAAVLVSGIAFMGATILSDNLVRPTPLKQTVLKIEGVETAAAPAPGGEPAAPSLPIAQFLSSADPSRGDADVKKLCSACHSFNEGGKAGVGPNLYGVVGGPHAHMEGYSYSSAIAAMHDKPWTFDELNAWLTKPSAYAPGTKMGFAGLASEKDRADIIAYLNSNSAHPLPLPAATTAPASPAANGNPNAGTGGAAAAPGQGTPTINAPNGGSGTPPQAGAPGNGAVPGASGTK